MRCARRGRSSRERRTGAVVVSVSRHLGAVERRVDEAERRLARNAATPCGRPSPRRAPHASTSAVAHVVDDAALAHDRDLVGRLQDLVELVADERDRAALLRPRRGAASRRAVSLSAGVSTDVGSSKMRIDGSRRRHLMISTRWRMPTGRSPTTASGSTSRPYRSEISRDPVADLGRSQAAAVAERDVLPHPQRLDEAEVLVHHADAVRGRGGRVERGGCASPSMLIVPASGSTRPIMIFISVDLPAPFSPSTPWIRPRAQFEVDAVARHHRAVALGDLVEPDRDPAAGGRARRPGPRLRERVSSSDRGGVSRHRTPLRRSHRTARRGHRWPRGRRPRPSRPAARRVASQMTAPATSGSSPGE